VNAPERLPLKLKLCKACKVSFTPAKPMQAVCSPCCAIQLAAMNRQKMQRKETREAKQKLKRRADWLREAQQAVNAWVRERDRDLPCISCGRHHQGQWHAGHYLSTGARPHLRFEPANIHKQCQPCNTHLSGNLINYRIGLIAKIGLEAVEALEADQEIRKPSIDDLKSIRDTYRAKLKELKREQ
jgi:hypothetical protein